MQLRRLTVMAGAMLLVGSSADAAPPVPAEFQDLYDELSTALDDFQAVLDAQWNGAPSPVAFSANLLTANSSRGAILLEPEQLHSVQYELNGLKALGIQAASLDVSFPVLDPSFHQTPGEYARYLGFYTEVVDKIQASGLQVVIETPALFTTEGYSALDVQPYYDSLTWEQYKERRAQMAMIIATVLQPDYLSVIQEPDTEAEQTGKAEAGTVAGSAELLTAILGRLQAAGVQGVSVGAGVGTWQADYRSFVDAFAPTAIDFVDIHVYPTQRDYLERAIEIADAAADHGKQIAMTETWLYKTRDSELGVLDFPTIFGRDVFSFWAPLDARHLQTMVDLAHFKGFLFASPFWVGYFRSYIEYDDSTKDLTPAELNALAEAQQVANILTGRYSTTALAYRDAVLDSPDVTPPESPPDFSVQLTSATTAAVTWSPSDDNVGTAAYQLFRDGAQVEQTATHGFSDSGLSDAQRYVYAARAFDASGNVSALSSMAVTTPDTTSPSVPDGLSAIATLEDSRLDILLSWSPSTDNVAVAAYRIYRARPPAPLALIAVSPTNSFVLPHAPPNVTFQFAVSALDTSWNDSGQSPPVEITTPVIPDSTPPVVNVPYPTAGSTLRRNTLFLAVAYDTRGGLYDEPSGPAAVQFRVDGLPFGSEQTVPIAGNSRYSVFRLQVDTRLLANGFHTITALCRDRAGNLAVSSVVTVRVVN